MKNRGWDERKPPDFTHVLDFTEVKRFWSGILGTQSHRVCTSKVVVPPKADSKTNQQ